MSRACVSCGGALRERFPRVVDPQSGEAFEIAACAECGLGHTQPPPADLGRYYGPAYHGDRHSFTARYCAARRLRLLTTTAGGRPGRLLDVGCGDGTFLLAARAGGWEVCGTELNPSRARAEGLEVEAEPGAFAGRPPFDRVTFWHTLEHMVEPPRILRTVRDLLAPGGELLIAVPDAGGLQARAFGERWFHLDVPRHLFHFDERSLSVLLERQGFEVVRRWHQELEYDVMGWSQSALNQVSGPPNLFFSRVTGRAPPVSAVRGTAHLLAGAVLSAVALPLTWVSTATGKGGTLIVQARRRDSAGREARA